MVRFSCFQTHIHSHKSKKTIIPQAEAMKTSPDYSQNQASKDSSFLTSRFSSLFTRPERDDARVIRSPSRLSSIVSASKLNEEIESLVDQSRSLKKSQSVGSILCQEGREGMDLESSPDGFEDHNKSTVESEHVNKETIFSIDDQASSGKDGNENSCAQSLGECVVDSGNQTPFSQHKLVRSYSVPKNIGASSSPPNSGEYVRHKNLGPRSRSSDDLLMMAYSGGEMKAMMTGKQASNDDICKTEITNVDNGYDVSYSALAFEVRPITNYEVGESSSHKLDELPSNDKFKRIKEWVSDLQPCSPLDEANEPELFTDQGKRDSSYTPSSPTLGKVDGKVNNPDTEAAKKYISSMSGSSTTAQMSNLGLVVIPFLSAFVSLRILNLSGNSIVRITAGSLPRGLHMLNLSKNNISTIEGLRELTRLRILDLRSNRITRIGHGLASCSSLKELYLAGNKISEVEGLHRLLKLSVLDLRFNKISTSKCLGQLAANYNSLQTISLEGNPAQRNVGDEQLKKYLHGLLPHLVDYNRLPVKPSSLKDAATDRSVRSGIGAHQFDRGLRSDHKGTRKSGHSLTTQRPSSSAASSTTHGHRGQSKVRTGRLPPGGPKVTSSDRHRHLDLSKGQEFKSVFSIPKSRSEGALGAF